MAKLGPYAEGPRHPLHLLPHPGDLWTRPPSPAPSTRRAPALRAGTNHARKHREARTRLARYAALLQRRPLWHWQGNRIAQRRVGAERNHPRELRRTSAEYERAHPHGLRQRLGTPIKNRPRCRRMGLAGLRLHAMGIEGIAVSLGRFDGSDIRKAMPQCPATHATLL